MTKAEYYSRVRELVNDIATLNFRGKNSNPKKKELLDLMVDATPSPPPMIEGARKIVGNTEVDDYEEAFNEQRRIHMMEYYGLTPSAR